MKGPHIVRVWQAKIFIKAVTRGQKLRRVAEMPLAEKSGSATALLHQLRQGNLVGTDAYFRSRTKRAMNAKPVGITTGHQRATAIRANPLRNVEVYKDAPLRCQPFEIRRTETF